MNRISLGRKQSKILKAIRDCGPPQSVPVIKGLLRHLRYCSQADVDAFGSVAGNLKRFSEDINLDNPHPDLTCLLGGQLVSEEPDSFNRIAVDVFQLYWHAAQSGVCSRVLDTLRNLFWSQDGLKTIDDQYSQTSIRFISDRSRRDALRAMLVRSCHVVGLGELYHAGATMWEQTVETFDGYARYFNKYEKDLEVAEARIQHFRSLNLPMMAEEIAKSVEKIKQEAGEDQYHGFKKISLTVASIILGKMHGYRFFDGGPKSACGWGNMVSARDGRYAYAPLDVFGDYEFYLFKSWPYDARIEYWPRLYACLELQELLPPRIKSLIEFLEEYPEVNKHPLFDQYHVLVPGLNYPYPIYGETMKLRKVNGEVLEFSGRPEEAHFVFDRDLIEHRLVTPVLLGERDREYYFISYFM